MFWCVHLSVCVLGFLCLDYSRSNDQIFMKKEPGLRQKLLIFGKDLDHILDTKE